MAKIKRLREERDAYMFMKAVLGDVNFLEGLAQRLDDPNIEWSADDYMFLHFDQLAESHRKFTKDAQKVAAFKKLYPNHGHLIDVANEMAECMDRLHQVREELIVPHLDKTGRDVAKHDPFPGELPVEDRAMLSGVNTDQQKAYEAQISRNGSLKLTKAEKTRLRDAILSELE